METRTARGRRIGVMALLAAIIVAAVDPAAAVERGAYIAVDYGKFRFDGLKAGFDADLDSFLECSVQLVFNDEHDPFQCSPQGDAAGTTSQRRQARGYDLWVGYQFSPWFAVEGAFLEMGKTRHLYNGTIDLGDADASGTVDGPLPLDGRISFRTRGPAFAAVGNLELGEYFSLDFRAGFLFAESKLSARYTVTLEDVPRQLTFGNSENKTSLFYGASANFWVTNYFSLRGGFAAFNKASFDRAVKQYFVGIRYSYGY